MVINVSLYLRCLGSWSDVCVQIGKALSGEWEYVEDEIKRINDAVVSGGSILKVIFEVSPRCLMPREMS